ncbi:MAG TPA: hypothetical protein PL161_04500 [Spirochaetota bacterium]|nr:hypothetical protein [Spirochaetota bacterium]
MKRIILLSLLLIAQRSPSSALLISEISPAGSPCDWVEIFFYSEILETKDISKLFLTVYYGSEEILSEDPVTVCSKNLPETPYDDRFIVVRYCEGIDETDYTGDSNKNGVIDVYVKGTSPWNTDSVIGLDDDSNLDNGAIDFAAYSVYDESVNSTVLSYLVSAVSNGIWSESASVEKSFVDIGLKGLSSNQSIIRLGKDTNSKNDFAVTDTPTPGYDNKYSKSPAESFTLGLKEKYLIEEFSGKDYISVNISLQCSLRFRIYSASGIQKYESQLFKDVQPGIFRIRLEHSVIIKLRSGMYILCFTGVAKGGYIKNSKTLMIVNRYK